MKPIFVTPVLIEVIGCWHNVLVMFTLRPKFTDTLIDKFYSLFLRRMNIAVQLYMSLMIATGFLLRGLNSRTMATDPDIHWMDGQYDASRTKSQIVLGCFLMK